MTEALKTDVTYTITSEPTYCLGDKVTSLAVGDRVTVLPAYATPDAEGDVKVRKAGGAALYLAAKCLTPVAKADDFKTGDKVRVAADAKTVGGGSVYFGGRQVEGVVVESERANGNLRVEASLRPGHSTRQYVDPAYLTKLDAEPEAADVVNVAALKKAADLLDVDLDKVLTFARAIEAGV